MIYTGLYTSAISLSQDTRLCPSIKKSANEKARLLDSIALQRWKRVAEHVLKVVKQIERAGFWKQALRPP
jgi:hypothetical protein